MAYQPVPYSKEMPPELLQARIDEKLVVFIGAGVSRLVGGWGWGDLVRALLKRCNEKGLIDKRQERFLMEKCTRENVYVEVISQCQAQLEFEDYFDILSQSCIKDEELLRNIDIYKRLKKIGNYYLTTNFDDFFDDYFITDNIVYNLEDLLVIDNVFEDVLYHIHGSIKNFESLVLTHFQYHDRYDDIANISYKTFLQNVFNEYTVLFIGYGMSEYVINTILYSIFGENSNNTHYIIKPYYINEWDKYQYDLKEMNRYGINIISYHLDNNSYNELYELIKVWDSRLDEVQLGSG